MVSNNGISNKTIPMPMPSSSSSSPAPSKGITPKIESCKATKAKAKLKRNKYDICVIGCGLSGSVIAERYASELNKSVLVIEKRDHIGGNCYDYIDPTTNIRVNKYGAHLFHTKSKRVYEYIQLFSDWTKYEHEVLGYVDDKYVPIPVNINTVNTLFNTNINTQHQMIDWLDKEKLNYSAVSSEAEASNSEEMAISRVGYRLYKKIFYPYTLKQWSEHPQNLGPEVTGRIPIRTDTKHKYFDDTYQCLPTNGYTNFFQNMLSHDNIELHLNIDYFDIQHHLQHIITDKIYFTGPIDHYYSHLGLPKLQYRSLNFQHKND